jgi:hypothetical protein
VIIRGQDHGRAELIAAARQGYEVAVKFELQKKESPVCQNHEETS